MSVGPTPKQRKAAKEVVKNLLSDKPIPTGQVLENVGYGQIVKSPTRITQSAGFQEALKEVGLKEALIKQGIDSAKIAQKIDLLLEAKDNDKDDYNSIDKGIKHATAIYGLLDKDESEKTPGNTYNFIFSQPVQNKIRDIDAEIKQMLTQSNDKED